MSGPATERVVLVGAAAMRFGLPLAWCREIVERTSCVPLPGSEPFVSGLINLRGRLVTVFDLGVRFGGPPATEAADHGIVILEHGGRTIGFVVETVERIATLEAVPLPGTGEAAAMTLHREVAAGPDLGGDRVVGVPNLEQILGGVLV